MSAIPIENFGKDHWSVLSYVKSKCEESKDEVGVLERMEMRCNVNTHPQWAPKVLHKESLQWGPGQGTRLAGYFDFPEGTDPEKYLSAGVQLRDHDDWDCLEDLRAAGYIEVISMDQGLVKLTSLGKHFVT